MALNRRAFRALRRTLDTIERDVPKQSRERFAQYCTGQIKRGIVNGVTPYGATFEALAAKTIRKKGHGKPLYAMGLLLAGAAAKATTRGVSFTDGTAYGTYHLTGTADMPARPWLPTRGLPARWRAELKTITEGAIRETME